jgi:Uma2 family endonuclease
MTTTRIISAVGQWSREGGSGYVLAAPGVLFSEDDAVAPDLVWVAGDRFALVAAEDGKLHLAPDLVVEVLSPGPANEMRDRQLKLDVYSRYGVSGYWVVNWQVRSVQIFRREGEQLQATAALTLDEADVAHAAGLCAAAQSALRTTAVRHAAPATSAAARRSPRRGANP